MEKYRNTDKTTTGHAHDVNDILYRKFSSIDGPLESELSHTGGPTRAPQSTHYNNGDSSTPQKLTQLGSAHSQLARQH